MAHESEPNGNLKPASDTDASVQELRPDEETVQVPVAQDILLRSFGRIVRRSIQSNLLNQARDSEEAKLLMESRSLVRTVATYGITRVATKSVSGAILVGTGLVAKMLFDRSQSRREAKRQGIANRHKSKD